MVGCFANIKPNTEKQVQTWIQKHCHNQNRTLHHNPNKQKLSTVITKNAMPSVVHGSSSEGRILKREKSKVLKWPKACGRKMLKIKNDNFKN